MPSLIDPLALSAAPSIRFATRQSPNVNSRRLSSAGVHFNRELAGLVATLYSAARGSRAGAWRMLSAYYAKACVGRSYYVEFFLSPRESSGLQRNRCVKTQRAARIKAGFCSVEVGQSAARRLQDNSGPLR